MKRRFIAGAVCPKCRAVDRIVLESDAQSSRRSCVDCDFVEELDVDAPTSVTTASVPDSRLLRSVPATAAPVPTQVVRFMNPPPKSDVNPDAATDPDPPVKK